MGRFPMESSRRAGMMFTTGKRVEVSVDKDEYSDVWFPALVLDSADGSFLVEYHSPGFGKEEGLIVVTVDHSHIRPTPPHLKDKKFDLLDKVDAFYDFGWWSGVITKQLADSRYIVFFKNANKERELGCSELRPHMEWKDGKWFTASQDNLNRSSSSSDHQGRVGLMRDTAKNNMEASHFNLAEEYMTKRTTPPPDTFHAFQHSYKKLKGGDSAKDPSFVSTQSFDIPSNSSKTNGLEQPRVGIQPSAKSDGLSWGKKVSALQIGGELRDQTTNSPSRSGRREAQTSSSPQASVGPKLRRSSPRASAGGKFSGVLQHFTRQRGKLTRDVAQRTAGDVIEKERVTNEIDIPDIPSLEKNGKGGRSPAKKPSQSPDKETKRFPKYLRQLVDDPSTLDIMGSNQLEGIAERTRRRWGTSKLPAMSPETPVEVEKQNGDVEAVELMVKEHWSKDDVHCSVTAASTEGSIPVKESRKLVGDVEKRFNSPRKPGRKSAIMNKKLVKKIRPKRMCVLLALKNQQETRTSNSRRRRTISLNTESRNQDFHNVYSAGETAEILEKDDDVSVEVVEEMDIHSNTSDDQPTSMLIDGKQSPTTVNDPKSSMIRSVDECTERRKETGMQLIAVNDEGESQPSDENHHHHGCFPFVKNTLLWKTIESMDVFRVMPQKPHFSNLGSIKETFREGLAIGSMVNFASVVDNTSKLQFDDPRSIIEDNLDILVELESFGFDVTLVRDRLTRLLLIKDEHEELEERSKEIKRQMNDHDLAKSDIDKEIDELDKQIQELQQKRAVAVSKKEKKDSEIGSLYSTVECINDDISTARLSFQGLAAAPWKVGTSHGF